MHTHEKDECETTMGERWTEQDLRTLVTLVRTGHRPEQITQELGRSTSAVASRITRTNIHRVAVKEPDVDNAPKADKATARKMRKCRWCLRQFESSGPGEWTCPPCKETSGYQQMA